MRRLKIEMMRSFEPSSMVFEMGSEKNGTDLSAKTPILLGLINGIWWGRAPPYTLN
jgi:hypothetical protein